MTLQTILLMTETYESHKDKRFKRESFDPLIEWYVQGIEGYRHFRMDVVGAKVGLLANPGIEDIIATDWEFCD